VLFLILVGLTFFCGWVFLQRMERLYRGHIYPHVYALGVPLGGMTRAEAADALNGVASQVNTGLLILTDGDNRWSYAWSQAGMRVDVDATAEAAYAIGRSGGFEGQLSIWLHYHDVAPRFTFDAEAARGLLEELSKEASRPPTEATIRLENGKAVIVPGEAGRVLNVTNTLGRLQAVRGNLYRVEVPLEFEIVAPAVPDTESVTAQAEALLARSVTVSAYDVLTGETLTWTLDREIIAGWLHLVPGADGEPAVDVNLYAIRDTLMAMAQGLGDGRGFRFDEAAQQVFATFDAGGGAVSVYLTHPERVYAVQSGDTFTSLSAQFGMPPGLVAEANPGIDYDHLSVGQAITIPSQDVLTPYPVAPGKKIVISLSEQRMRVYENGALLDEWLVSTGLPDSPTHRGIFQILSKEEKAYASQWDLWMPYFMAIYPAGGSIYNGIHELPIMAGGRRLWEGALGHPASFGCVILGIPEAETLYTWAEIGVLVVIE
jgi:lipoprotein-anchoring transpeptidase ErfK/SrfK